ncbi:MAG: acyloxyacyl hydrolase [Casimicrobiaceae bacterium]
MLRPALTAAAMVFVSLLVAAPTAARADDAHWFSAAAGSGENIDVLRIGGGWRSDCACEWLARIGATPFFDAHVEYWNARGDRHPNDNTWNVGATAGARWLLAPRSAWQPFVEFSVGGIAVSEARIGTRDLSTALLFDERLATGIALDPAHRYQFALFAEHRSNGKIKAPNDGLTTYGIELRVGWH